MDGVIGAKCIPLEILPVNHTALYTGQTTIIMIMYLLAVAMVTGVATKPWRCQCLHSIMNT